MFHEGNSPSYCLKEIESISLMVMKVRGRIFIPTFGSTSDVCNAFQRRHDSAFRKEFSNLDMLPHV